MELTGRVQVSPGGEPRIVRIEPVAGPWLAPRRNRAVISRSLAPGHEVPTVFAIAETGAVGSIVLPAALGYLQEGDIVRLNPAAGEVRVLYRRTSRFNSFLLTERCNSRCVMCSQPPREVDDGFLVDDLLEALPLMPLDTPELGFSGGEPTLLGDRLAELIGRTKALLPKTALHVLTNGRRFNDWSYAQKIARVAHPDLMFGIPLYADNARDHDFVVQAAGAFDQTVLGLLNLARLDIQIELRVVIHRETYRRLPQLAAYIVRNLPFVHHTALMGLELMGFARTNADALWLDPREFQVQLEAAVEILDAAGLRPVIFNLPHCVLPRPIWRFAAQSISDWKNVYEPVCDTCSVRPQCCGLFASSATRMRPSLNPVVGGATG